jgi:hypothetical protein
MEPASNNPVRERRWLLLAETGEHAWLGRATDPTEDEIEAAEASLRHLGKGGFLAITEGDYWSEEPLSLLEVRPLNKPRGSFDVAMAAFFVKRKAVVDAASGV